MALKQNLNLDDNFGINVTLNNVYIKAVAVNATKENAVISVNYANGDTIFQTKNFTFIPNLNNADNFIKQAYLYLKTLPEFVGAIDC